MNSESISHIRLNHFSPNQMYLSFTAKKTIHAQIFTNFTNQTLVVEILPSLKVLTKICLIFQKQDTIQVASKCPLLYVDDNTIPTRPSYPLS